MPDPVTLIVQASGDRVDRYISEQMPSLSRASVQRLIDDGDVRIDGVLRKASYRVRTGETIVVRVPPPEPSAARPEPIPLDVLYEDDDVLVVNKLPGMVVHPAAGHPSGTLVNAILAHCPGLSVGGVERPGIVHRLDSETSGIIVAAKTDAAMRDLQAQWKSHSVRKTYLALVEGELKPPRGKIDAPVGRDPRHRQKMAVIAGRAGSSHARAAVTTYRTLALSAPTRFGRYAFVQVEPETGRTHQIRVHFAFLGYPVVADAVYGKRRNPLGLNRQFLHAYKLGLTLPGGSRETLFTAPLPADLDAVLRSLSIAVPA